MWTSYNIFTTIVVDFLLPTRSHHIEKTGGHLTYAVATTRGAEGKLLYL